MTLTNALARRRGAGIMSVLVAAVVLISLFLIIGSFRNTGRQLLETSFEAKAFARRFPGSDAPGKLSAEARAGLVAALTGALQDADPSARRLAGFALGRVGPEAVCAVPALLGVMNSSDPAARRGAAAGLEGIAGLNVPKQVQWTLTDAALRRRARKALLKIGTPDTVRAAAYYDGECPESFRAPAVNWCD